MTMKTLRIIYGLHKIGAQPPYFSVTGDTGDTSGAIHEIILDAAPQLADLIALHLSDVNGVPMHPYANAHYWLIGATPAMHHTQRYHGANNSDTVRTPEQCLTMLAKHLRIELIDAQHLMVAANLLFETTAAPLDVANLLHTYVEAQRPRWKQQAQAAIAAHGLEVPA